MSYQKLTYVTHTNKIFKKENGKNCHVMQITDNFYHY